MRFGSFLDHISYFSIAHTQHNSGTFWTFNISQCYGPFAVEYLSFCLKAIITPVLVLLMSLCLLRGGLERVAAVLLTNVPMSCKSIEQGQQQRGSFDVTMNIFCSELQCSQRCQLSRGISFPFTLVFVSSYIYLHQRFCFLQCLRQVSQRISETNHHLRIS